MDVRDPSPEQWIIVYQATKAGLSRSEPLGPSSCRGVTRRGYGTHQPGDWLVHCKLCKDVYRFGDHQAAAEFAHNVHLDEYSHQRWVGRLALGRPLSEERGYDHPCSYLHPNQKEREQLEQRRREIAAEHFKNQQTDELAARRKEAPPKIDWVYIPMNPIDLRWTDTGAPVIGRQFWCVANGTAVAKIVALADGRGYLFSGWAPQNPYKKDSWIYIPTSHLDAYLGEAVAFS